MTRMLMTRMVGPGEYSLYATDRKATSSALGSNRCC